MPLLLQLCIADEAFENVNAANLPGVMWYLEHEVQMAREFWHRFLTFRKNAHDSHEFPTVRTHRIGVGRSKRVSKTEKRVSKFLELCGIAAVMHPTFEFDGSFKPAHPEICAGCEVVFSTCPRHYNITRILRCLVSLLGASSACTACS